MDETAKRPLLKEVNSAELLFFIEKKLHEREPVYLKADKILDVQKLRKNSLRFLQKEDKKKEVHPPISKEKKTVPKRKRLQKENTKKL